VYVGFVPGCKKEIPAYCLVSHPGEAEKAAL
jgi:hypothetical protein